MKADGFEKRLKSQPMRQVPGGWREQILSAAREAASARPVPRPIARSHAFSGLLSTINDQLSAFLWPHPAAWAGLAAVWLVILGLDYAAGATGPLLAKGAPSPAPQVFMAFQEQQRLLSELIGPGEPPVAERSDPAPPRPRSERRKHVLMG
jgi:hypothetical protein